MKEGTLMRFLKIMIIICVLFVVSPNAFAQYEESGYINSIDTYELPDAKVQLTWDGEYYSGNPEKGRWEVYRMIIGRDSNYYKIKGFIPSDTITYVDDLSSYIKPNSKLIVYYKVVGTPSRSLKLARKPGGGFAYYSVDIGNEFSETTSLSIDNTIYVSGLNSKYSLPRGKFFILKHRVMPADAFNKKVTYTSSNSKIATVDQSGKIIGKSRGKAYITVTTMDGNITKTCLVTVR
jgi:hypothetical protein